jgi:hypothetical protein
MHPGLKQESIAACVKVTTSGECRLTKTNTPESFHALKRPANTPRTFLPPADDNRKYSALRHEGMKMKWPGLTQISLIAEILLKLGIVCL